MNFYYAPSTLSFKRATPKDLEKEKLGDQFYYGHTMPNGGEIRIYFYVMAQPPLSEVIAFVHGVVLAQEQN